MLRASGWGDLPPLVVVHGLGASAVEYAWTFVEFRRACASILLPVFAGDADDFWMILGALRMGTSSTCATCVP